MCVRKKYTISLSLCMCNVHAHDFKTLSKCNKLLRFIITALHHHKTNDFSISKRSKTDLNEAKQTANISTCKMYPILFVSKEKEFIAVLFL